MTPAELIQWHEREAERFDEGGRGWRVDGHEAQAEAWFEEAAFHRSAAETVRGLVEGLEDIATRKNIDRVDCGALARRALTGAPTDEEKRA